MVLSSKRFSLPGCLLCLLLGSAFGDGRGSRDQVVVQWPGKGTLEAFVIHKLVKTEDAIIIDNAL